MAFDPLKHGATPVFDPVAAGAVALEDEQEGLDPSRLSGLARLGPSKTAMIPEPDSLAFDILEQFAVEQRPILSWLPEEQAKIAKSILSSLEDPENSQARLTNSLYMSDMFGIGIVDAMDLHDQMAGHITGMAGQSATNYLKELAKHEVKRKDVKTVVRDAFRMSGIQLTKALAGTAQMIGEFVPEIPNAGTYWLQYGIQEPFEIEEKLTEWGRVMNEATDVYLAEHPDEAIQVIPGRGFLGTSKQLLQRPENILQGALEAVPMMMEAYLGHLTGTSAAKYAGWGQKLLPWLGRVLGIAAPITAATYADSRKNGAPPSAALPQSILTGLGEGIIEEWTLGAKVKVFKGVGLAARKGIGQTTAAILLGGGKSFGRGVVEEAGQRLNQNFWNMVFSDPDQVLLEGVSEDAATGGFVELFMTGTAAVAGKAVSTLTPAQKELRVEQIRKDINKNEGFSPEEKIEINAELDRVIAEDITPAAAEAPAGEVAGREELGVTEGEGVTEDVEAAEAAKKVDSIAKHPNVVEANRKLEEVERRRDLPSDEGGFATQASGTGQFTKANKAVGLAIKSVAKELGIEISTQDDINIRTILAQPTPEAVEGAEGEGKTVGKQTDTTKLLNSKGVDVIADENFPIKKGAVTIFNKKTGKLEIRYNPKVLDIRPDTLEHEAGHALDIQNKLRGNLSLAEAKELATLFGLHVESFFPDQKQTEEIHEKITEDILDTEEGGAESTHEQKEETFAEALSMFIKNPLKAIKAAPLLAKRLGIKIPTAEAVEGAEREVSEIAKEENIRKFAPFWLTDQMPKEIFDQWISGELTDSEVVDIALAGKKNPTTAEKLKSVNEQDIGISERDPEERNRRLITAPTIEDSITVTHQDALGVAIEAGLKDLEAAKLIAVASELGDILGRFPTREESIAEFKRREKALPTPTAKPEGEVQAPGLTAEATVKSERKKNKGAIVDARAIEKDVKKLQKEVEELDKLVVENNKRKGTTQFDEGLGKSMIAKQVKKLKEIDKKSKQAVRTLRDRIEEMVKVKGLSKKDISDLSLEHTGFRKLTGRVVEKKITVDKLVDLLEAIEKARPTIVGHKRVLSQKTEDQIAAFKDSLIKAKKLTESEFTRILGLATSKGFGQVGEGKPRPPRFISAESFITQEEARDLLDRMHDSAQVFRVTEPLKQAVENKPEIKAAMEEVVKQPPSIGDPTLDTIPNRIRNAVFGTDFFDRLYSMRFYAQRLGDRMSEPVYKIYNQLRRTGQRLTRERQKVFDFLGTLPDFDLIAADNEALQRVSDAIASKSNLKNRPAFPMNITPSEMKLVAEIEKIFKVYEFHAKVGKFFQHKEDLTRMPQYLKFKDSIDKALDIYDTEGVDALFEYIKTQDWGVVSAGYEPMRSVIRKISTHQMPDIAVGKTHIKVRGIEYAQQDRNILSRLQSYMRQMDMLAFMQPTIKAWVRMIGDNIHLMENPDNIQQVVSTYLNNLKKTNVEDGLVEEVMRRLYSQAITTRVLADPIKPLRNLLQNAAFSEDRGDLVNKNNKPLSEKDLEFLETFVQQDRVMMSDWAFAGLDPLNLPVIGQRRLGLDKLTKWVQRHSQYPASDRLNRHWSFWAKINRVRNAFAKDQSLDEKMKESRFTDMQRSEQILALEILATEGVNAMSRFIAQVHTDNTHFLYAREDRSPAEQTRVGKLVLNLILFKRAATEKWVLQMQKATQTGTLQSRVRAARVIVSLVAWSALMNILWKTLTGNDRGPYDFINFLEINSGGLELASVQKVEDVYNLMLQGVTGDEKALDKLPRAITTSADYFIPFYDLGTRAIEATLDDKNIDIQALQAIRKMIDDEYKARGRPKIDRSLLEKFQFTFGGPAVDRKEKKKKSGRALFTGTPKR